MNDMATKPSCMSRKPFQEATVHHAISRLLDLTGSRRFLVADEVGLGKTLVAQGILQYLATGSRPLNVFYICSSLTIANQNRDSLLEVLPERDRKGASVNVDRPTLLPWETPPTGNRFTLFTLTPGTLPIKDRSRGRVDERASIWCLLKAGLVEGGPAALDKVEEGLCHVQSNTWEKEVIPRSSGPMQLRMQELAIPFLAEIRKLFKLPNASDRIIAETLAAHLRNDAYVTIQLLRKRLGRIGLQKLKPDLVILDEFQRFFELLEPFEGLVVPERRSDISGDISDQEDKDEDAHGLLRMILGARADHAGPAVLLLSATPYRPPGGGMTDGSLQHYDQFFKLLKFLYGTEADAQVTALRKLFRRYGVLLREASPGNTEVLSLRDQIQGRLTRVISRTERSNLLGADGSPTSPERVQIGLSTDDVRIYRNLWDSACEGDRSAVTPYWSSIPYPLQMMDLRYVLRKNADPKKISRPLESPLLLHPVTVRRYGVFVPPHPRMRALLKEVKGPLLGLPWLPPTMPWWPLGSPFQEAVNSAPATGLSKLLLFSRFRAVPKAVASLISYESERMVFGEGNRQGRHYDYLGRRRSGRDEDFIPEEGLDPLPAKSFTWHGQRDLDHPLLSLFIPSPTLGEIGDPQRIPGFKSGGLRRGDALEFVVEKLRAWINDRPDSRIQIRTGARTGQVWRALVRLERINSESWSRFSDALKSWKEKSKIQGAKAVAEAWLEESKTFGGLVTEPLIVTSADLEELAELALAGPGVVLLRAAQRVFGASCDGAVRMRRTMEIALGALPIYLDEPEFHLTLTSRVRTTPNHPDEIRKAVWNGNFEAVLDEYFAVQAGLGARFIDSKREGKALDALEQALGIRVSTIHTQGLEGAPPFGMRCHVAMPFGLTPDKEERRREDGPEARPDALRMAFNSPFRPFVLATTSIGQEGLDFHVYCDRLVHWDLPSSPVDLEQRDGRINRYGGLAIRKALIRQQGGVECSLPENGSPWLTLTRSLPESCEGMSPWWGTQGAVINRTVFLPPLSRQEADLDHLLAGLSHYRLALGQSDPEQLLRALHRKMATSTEEERAILREWLHDVRIDLAPVRNGITPLVMNPELAQGGAVG
jgi:hypothetical protein